MRAGIRLGIDYGTATSVAVLQLPGGMIVPGPVEPAPVFVVPETGVLLPGAAGAHAAAARPDCYVLPYRHLGQDTVEVAGRPVSVVDLLAAALGHIAASAAAAVGAPVTAVSIAVPAGWGPRRRTVIQQAAVRAGLPAPELVAAPAAAAAHLAALTGVPPAAGSCVLVCDAGAAGLHLSVLHYAGPGWPGVLATRTLAEAGGDAVDAALAEQLTAVAPWPPTGSGTGTAPAASDGQNSADRYTVVTGVRHAKQQLATAARAALALADDTAVVLDRDRLAAVTTPAWQHLPDQVGELLAAADVNRGDLHAVILTGGGAALPGLADAVTHAAGRPPVIPARPDLAAADGALRGTGTAAPVGAATTGPVRPPRLGVREVAAPVLIWLASAALLLQAYATTWTQTVNTAVAYAYTQMSEVGVAGALVMLAAFAAAHTALVGWAAAGDSREPAATGMLIRRAYPGATALGLIMAAIYGMILGILVGVDITPYVRWALLPALPTAAAAAVILAVASRIPTHASDDWLRHARAPLLAALLAAAGTYLMESALASDLPASLLGTAISGRAGAVLLAVGIAFTITRQRLLRLATAVILAATGLIAFGLTTAQAGEIAYLCALAWWAATVAGHTLRAGFPNLTARLRRWLDPSTT